MTPPILNVAPALHLLHSGLPPFLVVPSFLLPGPGTYTLEGPNGSGKSMFVRFLTGTLPGGVDRSGVPTIEIDGKAVPVASYRNALDAGIVAVFQDDDLISSMTILEYLYLRHAPLTSSELLGYLWGVLYHFSAEYVVLLSRILGPSVNDWMKEHVEHLEPTDPARLRRKDIRENASKLLARHGVPTRILNEVPTKLSGGARASARLVAAQLQAGTRVLLMDEPFNSVERNVWPVFVDTIKQWAKDSGTAVLAISHNSEELARWEPDIRFEIRDGELNAVETFRHGVKRRIADGRTNPVPIFEFATGSEDEKSRIWKDIWDRLGPRQCIVISESSPELDTIRAEVDRYIPPGIDRSHIPLSGVDLEPTTPSFERLFQKIAASRPGYRTVFIVLGGSELRTLGSFAALHSAHLPGSKVLIVPTSFADAMNAVVGSTIEMAIPSGKPDEPGVPLSAVFSPDAYALNLFSLKEGAEDYTLGLVGCLRLGLLFDPALFETAKSALLQPKRPVPDLIAIFHRAVGVVNELVEIGPFSTGVVRMLRFGEEHSHCIEASAAAAVGEGRAVLLGMILESILAGENDLAASLSAAYRSVMLGPLPPCLLDDSKFADLRDCYRSSGFLTKSGGNDQIDCLRITTIGQFALARLRDQLSAAAVSQRGRFNRSISRFASSQAEAATVSVNFDELGSSVLRLRHLCSSTT